MSNSSVDNCLIAGNQADSGGGGVFSDGGVVRNCTIVGNSTDLYGGGGVNADSGAVSIINCIVRDNIFGDVNAVGAQLSVLDNVLHVSYSNIAGGQAKVLLEGCYPGLAVRQHRYRPAVR